MRSEIIKLCKQHDVIKNSDIRLKGIEGEILPPLSKDRYNLLIRNFAFAVRGFFENYKKVEEIKITIQWGKERNYNIEEIIDSIYECYAQYDDDEFIAALDFMVLSKLHYLVEYAYLQIFKQPYTQDFLERLK